MNIAILAGVTTNYTYDNLNQLTEEAIVGGTTTDYTYDANGNRATKVVGGTTETYHNDDADKLTSITVGATTTKSYHFDANGNTDQVTTSAGTTYLTYDYENRVTGITYPSTATNSFAYNGLDTRVGKTDSAGTSTYRRDGIGVTAPVLNDGTVAYTPGLSTHTSTQDRFDHADRLGSNIRQTNTSNGVTSNVTWDAFGNATSTSGTQVGPFGFAGSWGYQADTDSGLKLLGHRYYDPSTGRFLSRDPAKDSRNWYTYCSSNPLHATDPSGHGDLEQEQLWWQIMFYIWWLLSGHGGGPMHGIGMGNEPPEAPPFGQPAPNPAEPPFGTEPKPSEPLPGSNPPHIKPMPKPVRAPESEGTEGGGTEESGQSGTNMWPVIGIVGLGILAIGIAIVAPETIPIIVEMLGEAVGESSGVLAAGAAG